MSNFYYKARGSLNSQKRVTWTVDRSQQQSIQADIDFQFPPLTEEGQLVNNTLIHSETRDSIDSTVLLNDPDWSYDHNVEMSFISRAVGEVGPILIEFQYSLFNPTATTFSTAQPWVIEINFEPQHFKAIVPFVTKRLTFNNKYIQFVAEGVLYRLQSALDRLYVKTRLVFETPVSQVVTYSAITSLNIMRYVLSGHENPLVQDNVEFIRYLFDEVGESMMDADFVLL